MIRVHHALQPKFAVTEETILYPAGFRLVAEVDTNNLDVAFALTQTGDTEWWFNPGVTAHVKPCRSTSVGDVLERDGCLYAVDSVGFTELVNPEKDL